MLRERRENHLRSEVPHDEDSKLFIAAKVINMCDTILRKSLNFNKIFGEIFDT